MEYSIEEFDKAKAKVMNYIMYKKRTEYEVRTKFSKTLEENLLDDIIDYIKNAGYLSDEKYIERAVNEFRALKNFSIREIKYKLISKGIKNSLIEDYISNNYDELNIYEIESAKRIVKKKKSQMELNKIKDYLRKKGYTEESTKEAIIED